LEISCFFVFLAYEFVLNRFLASVPGDKQFPERQKPVFIALDRHSSRQGRTGRADVDGPADVSAQTRKDHGVPVAEAKIHFHSFLTLCKGLHIPSWKSWRAVYCIPDSLPFATRCCPGKSRQQSEVAGDDFGDPG
jgi:hypothetical protein